MAPAIRGFLLTYGELKLCNNNNISELCCTWFCHSFCSWLMLISWQDYLCKQN